MPGGCLGFLPPYHPANLPWVNLQGDRSGQRGGRCFLFAAATHGAENSKLGMQTHPQTTWNMQENCVEHEALTIITSKLVNYIVFVAISIKEDYKTRVSGIGCHLKSSSSWKNFRRSSSTHSRGTVEGVDLFLGQGNLYPYFFGRIFGIFMYFWSRR